MAPPAPDEGDRLPGARRISLADIAGIAPAPATRRVDLEDVAAFEVPAAPRRLELDEIAGPASAPAPATSSISIFTGPGPLRGIAPSSGQFSPQEIETIGQSPVAQMAQTPASAFPLQKPPLPPDAGPQIGAAPVAKAPMPVQPNGYFNPKTGAYTHPAPFGQGPLDVIAEGPPQVARGLAGLVNAAVTPSGVPIEGAPSTVNPKTGQISRPTAIAPATMNAGSDVIEGTFKLLTPVMMASAAAAPVRTAVTLAVAEVLGKAGATGADLLGGGPEAQRLAGDVGKILGVAVVGSDQAERYAAEARNAAADAIARAAARERGTWADEAPPPEQSLGFQRVSDRPAAEDHQLPAAQQALPPAPEPAEAPPEPPAPPPIDVQAAIRDIADAPPNSPASLTALAALQRAGMTPAAIDAAVEAHVRATTPQEPPDATQTRSEPPSGQPEYPPGDQSGPPAETSGGHRLEQRPTAPQAAPIEPPGSGLERAPVTTPDARPIPLAHIATVEPPEPEPPEPRPIALEDIARIEPPEPGGPESLDTRPPTAIDSETARAATEAPIPPSGPLAPRVADERVAPAGSGPVPQGRRPARRRAPPLERTTNADVLDELVQEAVTKGHTGDPAALRRELEDRLQLIADLDAEFDHHSGHSPDVLLRAIAGRGGISDDAETGYKGELRLLKEERDTKPSASRKNLQAPPVFADTTRGVKGVFRKSGLSLDDMLRSLHHEQRFQYIETIDDLIDEVRRAARTEIDRRLLAERLRDSLGPQWWQQVGVAAHVPDESDSVEPLHEGDISFDPAEFDEPPPNATLHAQLPRPIQVGDLIEWHVHAQDGHLMPRQGTVVEMLPNGDIRAKTPGLETPRLVRADLQPRLVEPAQADVLDTGELQPRLPEAGQVREQEHATPQFDVPFSLTSEVAQAPKTTQEDLFGAGTAAPAPLAAAPRIIGDSITQHGAKIYVTLDAPARNEQAVREALPANYRDVVKVVAASNDGNPIDFTYFRLQVESPQAAARLVKELKRALAPARAAVPVGARGGGRRDRARETTPPPQRAAAPVAGKHEPSSSAGGFDAAFVPGGRQFVDRDVVPTLQQMFEKLLQQREAVKAAWSPDAVSTAGSTAANVVRAHKALEAQQMAKTARLVENLGRLWDRVPREQQIAFAIAVDGGDIGSLPPWQRAAARLFAEINGLYRREVQRRGGFKNGYIEHYFPREWDRPGRVRQWLQGLLAGRRPFKGRQGFRKARKRNELTGETFTFKEMYDAGFRPKAYNPVEAHLRKWAEMRKWISAYDILREHKALGVAKYIEEEKHAPRGWVRYPESYGTVYGKPAVTVEEAFDPVVRDALEQMLADLQVPHTRKVRLKGNAWGLARADVEVLTKFGGPEGVLEHELGHILDHRFGLGASVRGALEGERREEQNFGEKSWAARELAALADLRLEGVGPASNYYKSYIRNKEEKTANLVHAFIYIPERAKEVAPNSYWALYNLAKDTPELQPLIELQKARGVSIRSDTREVTIPGTLIVGHYYGPAEAVRIMERYLSPGLAGSRAFQALHFVGNKLVQVKLGFSAFHLVTTGLEAVIAKSALGIERLSRGDVRRGLADIAVSPAAPLISFWRGSHVLDALRTGDPDVARFDDLASQVIQAGGRAGRDPFWHDQTAIAKWRAAWRGVAAEAKAGNYPGAAARTVAGVLRVFPVIMEAQAKAVMEEWVPRMKLAAFADLARLELEDLGEVPDLVEGRRALANAWDSVDNRFGELIYDNLFWDRRVKDFALAIWQAPGWNIGTVREVFGAVPAQLSHLAALAGGGGSGKRPPTRTRHEGYAEGPNGEQVPRYVEGRAPWLTHQFAYFLSFLFWVAVFGAMMQYLHTGKKPGEQDDGTIDPREIPLDLFFPRRERNEQNKWDRVVLPSYMRDLFAALHDFPSGLTTMVRHKIHPLWAMAAELIGNEDYWGTEIRDPEDPVATQLKDGLLFLAGQMKPISYDSMQRGTNRTDKIESLFGLTKAPAYVTRSPLENYLRDQAPPVRRTKAQAAAADVKRDIRTEAKTDRTAAQTSAREAVREGALSPVQARNALKASPGILVGYQHLDLNRAIHAYELANTDERKTLLPALRQKASNATVPADERQLLRDRLVALGVIKAAAPGGAR